MNLMCDIKHVIARKIARPVPIDFEVIFVEQGRLACETWYHARRTTVTRWLEESGKQRLIEKRAAYVRSMRRQGKWITRATNMVERRKAPKPSQHRIKDSRKIDPELATAAANYLRCVRNGGWRITDQGNGYWIVGIRERTSAELLELAIRKGFVVNLQLQHRRGDD